MPHHVTFSSDSSFARFEFSGTVDYQQLEEMMRSIAKRPNLEAMEAKIIDLCRLESLAADRQQLVELSLLEREVALRAPKCAVAILVSSDYVRGLASMWATLIQQTGFLVEIFDAGSDAEFRIKQWLDANRPRRSLSPA